MSSTSKKLRTPQVVEYQDPNASYSLHRKLTPTLFKIVLSHLGLLDHRSLHCVCKAMRRQRDGGGNVSFLESQFRSRQFHLMESLSYLKREALDLIADSEPLGDLLLRGKETWRVLHLIGTPLWPLAFRTHTFPSVTEVDVNACEVVEGTLLVENLPQLQVLRLQMGSCRSLTLLQYKKWQTLTQLEVRGMALGDWTTVVQSIAAIGTAAPQLQTLGLHSADPSYNVDLIINEIAKRQLHLTSLSIDARGGWITGHVTAGGGKLLNQLTELNLTNSRMHFGAEALFEQLTKVRKLTLINDDTVLYLAGAPLRRCASLRYLTINVASTFLGERVRFNQVTHLSVNGEAALSFGVESRHKILALQFQTMPDLDRLLTFTLGRGPDERLVLQLPVKADVIPALMKSYDEQFSRRPIRILPFTSEPLRADQIAALAPPKQTTSLSLATRQVAKVSRALIQHWQKLLSAPKL